jgi:hypothetical protein
MDVLIATRKRGDNGHEEKSEMMDNFAMQRATNDHSFAHYVIFDV